MSEELNVKKFEPPKKEAEHAKEPTFLATNQLRKLKQPGGLDQDAALQQYFKQVDGEGEWRDVAVVTEGEE